VATVAPDGASRGAGSSRLHVVPLDVFDALAAGGGGERGVRLLAAAQRSKRILLLEAIADRVTAAVAQSGTHPSGTDPARAFDLLAAVQAASPAGARAVERVLAYPSVSGWAHAAGRSLLGGLPVPEPGYFATAVAAAAVRGRVAADVVVPARGGRVILPSLGSAVTGPADSGGTAVVRSRADGATVETPEVRIAVPQDWRDTPGWARLRRVQAAAAGLRLDLALDDVDPFSFPPTAEARRTTLADAGPLRRAVAGGWSLLATGHRGAAVEIGAVLLALVPVTARPGGHASSTSRDAFGSVAMSVPATGLACAVTLVHEVQHAKLGALLDLVPLTDDPGTARWYAPWRDDPRPLSGLLQGAYAYLGVTGFWRRQRRREQRPGDAAHAHTEFARWRDGTWTAVETLLSSGALTPAGRRFVDGMAATLSGWRREHVPDEPAERAHAARAGHRRDWLRRNSSTAAQLPGLPRQGD
jgi:HEXXH motif-containing protein